jgi:hypothetical protein
MLRRVGLVTADVSEDRSTANINLTRIGELGMAETLGFSETSVLTRATRRNIPEESIPHCLKMVQGKD